MKRIHLCLALALLGTVATAASAATAARVAPVSTPPPLKPLVAHIPGRVLRKAGEVTYQWPGLYFEARFDGPSVYFKSGNGDAILRVLLDGDPIATLVKPASGVYEIGPLPDQAHTVRIESLSEYQDAPNVFGGFHHSKGTRPLSPPAARSRQVEFIGDSHTVGYGNISATRTCTEPEVWATTDSSVTFGAKIARHYGADYQINAISGRGIVRNYDGSPGDPLPIAYPFTLLDNAARFESRSWRPQVIVIALGTNDFSTPLKAGEKWATRDALHADYEATYAKFLAQLRARNPDAFVFVWATDLAEREIQVEARKVVEQRKSGGDTRIDFIPIDGLAMSGCDWHPSVADDDTIAEKLIPLIDARNPWAER